MRRLAIVAALAAGGFAVAHAGITSAQEDVVEPVKPVKVAYTPPRKVMVLRRSFTPDARPSPARVHFIIRMEARGRSWLVGALERRIGCESGFKWNAKNGQYLGLLQFAPGTWTRGVSTLGDRRVRLPDRVFWRPRRGRVRIYWPNGRVVLHRAKTVHRQKVVVRTAGRLPRWPEHTHGWAQVRVGVQALLGRSAVRSSEWECGA